MARDPLTLCGNCKWYEGGECHLNPPILIRYEKSAGPWLDDEREIWDDPVFGYPEVDPETDWCSRRERRDMA